MYVYHIQYHIQHTESVLYIFCTLYHTVPYIYNIHVLCTSCSQYRPYGRVPYTTCCTVHLCTVHTVPYSTVYNMLYCTSCSQYILYHTVPYIQHAHTVNLVHSTKCAIPYHVQHTVLYIFAQYNCTAHTVSILYYINAAYCKLRLLTFCIAIVY